MTVRKSGINLTFCLHALVLSETETVTHAYIASTRDFKQIATATSTTAMVDTETWGEYVARSPPDFNFKQAAPKQWLRGFSLICFRC